MQTPKGNDLVSAVQIGLDGVHKCSHHIGRTAIRALELGRSQGALRHPHSSINRLGLWRLTDAHHQVISLESLCSWVSVSMVSCCGSDPDPSVAFPPLLSFMVSLVFSPRRIRSKLILRVLPFLQSFTAVKVPKISVLAFYMLWCRCGKDEKAW